MGKKQYTKGRARPELWHKTQNKENTINTQHKRQTENEMI